MKKITLIAIIALLLSSCNMDRTSIPIIISKSSCNTKDYGKFKYTTIYYMSNNDNENLIFYSDSDWNVGDKLKLVKE